MTTYLSQCNFQPPCKAALMNDISRKWEKWFHTGVTLIAYNLCNDQ